MQPSADTCQYSGPLAEQPIVATNSSQYNSLADVGLRTARRNSNKMFQLIVRYVFTVRFKQQYQSKMQWDLVNFTSSKTISNAKLANNDLQLIVVLTLILNCEGLCAVLITSYSLSDFAGNVGVVSGIFSPQNDRHADMSAPCRRHDTDHVGDIAPCRLAGRCVGVMSARVNCDVLAPCRRYVARA